jgi:hypothetical protein
MVRELTVILGGALILIAAPFTKGLKPRPTPQDYAAQVQIEKATLAASALSKREIKNAFASDLNNNYIVIEVGVFPAATASLHLSPDDFLLRMGDSGDIVRPSSADIVSAAVDRKKNPETADRNIDVVQSASVGYENGIDPYTGRRVSGVSTAAGVGVGVSPNRDPYGTHSQSSDWDRTRTDAELNGKSFPEGAATGPVAGYLYFALPSKKKSDSVYQLDYDNGGKMIHMYVPPPKS